MKTVLVTGANRGLGLEFTDQLSAMEDIEVIAACRVPHEATDLELLANNRKNLSIVKLDVADDESVASLVQELSGKPLDWLINNAGITGTVGLTIGNIDRINFLHVMNVNCLSALKMSEAFLPNLQLGDDKLIVNLSSVLGSVSSNIRGRGYAYRASKAALNCVMRSFAIDVEELGIKVMLLNPGWVKTGLGGPNATVEAKTSVAAMLEVIEKHKADSHAEVFRNFDDTIVNW